VLSSQPTSRRVALSAGLALLVGLAVIRLLEGSVGPWELRLLEGLAVFGLGALVVGAAMALATVRLAGWRDPESEAEFDAIVERAERLAAEGSWGEFLDEPDDDDDLFDPVSSEEDFRALVRSAIDELPLEFHRALEHVAVVVSDGGRRRRAYGLYEGDTVARDNFPDRIVIFRDTLVRDFGHDPELLRAQVTRVVRHELAHHLGWDEDGVRGLGL
jgi:predicted Zn-dependent protease with MMP-like domain